MTKLLLLLLHFVLLLLVWIPHSIAVDTTETCEADKDGSCAQDGSQQKNDCKDEDDRCAWWSNQGECDANPGFMLRNCQKSCNVCYTGKTAEELIAEAKKKKEEKE